MEKFISIKEQELLIKEIIISRYNNLQYHKDAINNYFRISGEHWLNEFNISLYSSNKIHFFSHGMSCFKVEEIILEIGMPTKELSSFKAKKNYLLTIRNNNIHLSYNTEERPVETERDCIDYCQSIIGYTETGGKAFVEEYSYLPNVLKKMNNLEADSKFWNGMYMKGGLISGGFESNFRGLIISKLCNDIDFERKLSWIEGRLVDNSKFIPYFEKLKKRLESVEPIYNIA